MRNIRLPAIRSIVSSATMPSLVATSNKKIFNNWEKSQVIISALIPIVVAASAYFLNDGLARRSAEQNQLLQDAATEQAVRLRADADKQTQMLQERAAEQERLLSDLAQQAAAQQANLNRMALIPQFMDALTGTDPVKRRLAIKTILTALPQDGPILLAELQAEGTTNTPSADAALITRTISNEAATLARGIFGPNPTSRVSGYDALAASGLDQATVLIPAVLSQGEEEPRDEHGVVNSLIYLKSSERDALLANKDRIDAYLALVENNGPQTRENIDEVRARMR